MSAFYIEQMDTVFRFGDVVRGFASSTPILPKPLLDGQLSYNLEICTSINSVVLSPCCSIENGILSLAPLQRILPVFYQNPWLIEDFTRVNRKMPAEKSVPPHKWNSMPQGVKENEFDLENDGYAFTEFFVYQEHPLLPQYKLDTPSKENPRTGHYLIDFRTAYRINCDKIKRNHGHPLEAKVLQLSKECRAELRNKITFYYARIPKEDNI